MAQTFLVDQIDDLPVPAEAAALIGHDNAFDDLCAKYASGALHHAWLITGPRGIGKATFAFQLAAYLLKYPEATLAPAKRPSPSDFKDITRRIAGGGHPNLLYLARGWDERQKKFKSELTVDVVRRTIDFFGTTTGEPGWRICIVDSADEMNRNAANALLKVLEEPPPKTVFLVISHVSGRLLPTIRSRCQRLPLEPLSNDDLRLVLSGMPELPQLDDGQLTELVSRSRGSVRVALELLTGDGIALQKRFESLFQTANSPDWPAIHALAGELSQRTAENKFRLFLEHYFSHIAAQARKPSAIGQGALPVAHWTQLWEKAHDLVRETEAFNLDRKQMILSLFERMRSTT